MKQHIKIAILEDHFLVAHSIQEILKSETGAEVVFVSDRAEPFLKFIKRSSVDLVFLDLQLPDKHGLDVVRYLKDRLPQIKIIILSCIDDLQVVQHLMDLGCDAYLCKGGTGIDDILQAYSTVRSGDFYLSDSMKIRMENNKLAQEQNLQTGAIKFTKREMEVLLMMNTGLGSKEISEKLFISPRTVESHRQNLMYKLEVKNSAALLHKAALLNLLKSE